MDNSVEASGKTVDEAVEQALEELGLSRAEVDVEVLSEGTRGRFGRAGEPAHVVVRPLATSAVAAGSAARADSADSDVIEDAGEEAQPRSLDDADVGRAHDILVELLRLIDIEAAVTVRSPETPGDGVGQASAVLDVHGDDLGLLIGRRGETLAALQYMVNLLLNQGAQGHLSVTVDVEQYRRRREHRIVTSAQRAADEAEATGRTVLMEPMPANERRIVHIALADDPRVTTSSVGAGQDRQVSVSPHRA